MYPGQNLLQNCFRPHHGITVILSYEPPAYCRFLALSGHSLVHYTCPLTEHEELVKGEAGRRRDLRHEGRKPIDAIGDLADLGLHAFLQEIESIDLSVPWTTSQFRST